MPLTKIECDKAQSRDKPYKLADGAGMYLEVMPNGSKYWRYKYRWQGKERRLALGVFPLITLAEARDKRDQARKQLANGVDPSSAKQEIKRQVAIQAANTFMVVAEEWFEINKDRWTAGTAEHIQRRLQKDIYPYIGARPIADITPPELLDCLRKIEKRGALEIAGRIKQTCGQIFRYGVQTGRCDRDPSVDLKGALKSRKVKHHATIDASEIPEFIATLERNEARLFERTRRAIWLSLLTFTRPGEIRQARWSEIDFDARQWSIPAERMKMRRDHIVPLSRQAIEVLKAQKEETDMLNTEYVFPSQVRPRNPMSDGTVNMALKRLGYGQLMVAHGFRALARTTIREKLKYDSEIIEKQLAHQTRNPLGEAYDRTQFLDERREMMQAWGDYLDGIRK
jgi:integrase